MSQRLLDVWGPDDHQVSLVEDVVRSWPNLLNGAGSESLACLEVQPTWPPHDAGTVVQRRDPRWAPDRALVRGWLAESAARIWPFVGHRGAAVVVRRRPWNAVHARIGFLGSERELVERLGAVRVVEHVVQSRADRMVTVSLLDLTSVSQVADLVMSPGVFVGLGGEADVGHQMVCSVLDSPELWDERPRPNPFLGEVVRSVVARDGLVLRLWTMDDVVLQVFGPPSAFRTFDSTAD